MQVRASFTSLMRQLFSGRRGRDLREYLTAYLFIAPAITLIFVFGIFPVAFALYVSLHKWLIVQGPFRGLQNYTSAIANLAYIGAFALGLGALIGAYAAIRRVIRELKDKDRQYWLLSIPGLLYALSTAAFFRWLFFQLPEFLQIANRMRGLERTRALFIRLLSEAFHAETVYPAWGLFVWLLLASFVAGAVALWKLRAPDNAVTQAYFGLFWLGLITGIGISAFTFQSVQTAYANAVETGVDPGIWPQLISVTSGVLLLLAAWYAWRSAEKQDSLRSFGLRILGAIGLLVGAVLLIVEIPTIVASGDADMWEGLKVTVFFSLGTVPVQLTIALFLSVLLFQRLKGSDFFRIVFFLPYVTPAVASATVFRLIFSDKVTAPANIVAKLFGVGPLRWRLEPQGILSMIADGLGLQNFPNSILPGWLPTDLHAMLADWLTGPSLALVVVIMLSVWIFVGYNVVIYLAGLGNIPTEVIEAAEIDGASNWDVFRHITFPLLSPTTYFLSLIAVMGTFKAFNTIWVLRGRDGQALGTTDTFSVVIFQEFFLKTRYGYATALAFILFAIILILTYFNNRIQGSRVFYG